LIIEIFQVVIIEYMATEGDILLIEIRIISLILCRCLSQKEGERKGRVRNAGEGIHYTDVVRRDGRFRRRRRMQALG
jgi:hypothetical protein